MRVPSRDHTAETSRPASAVRRDRMLVAISITQTSTFSGFPVPKLTATRRSSGDSATLRYGAGSPTVPTTRPRRSNQVNCGGVSDLFGAYNKVPVSDTDAL